ncbi:hypothetical protein ACA910_022535 [Epithemia clementina (nom. ined.)]
MPMKHDPLAMLFSVLPVNKNDMLTMKLMQTKITATTFWYGTKTASSHNSFENEMPSPNGLDGNCHDFPIPQLPSSGKGTHTETEDDLKSVAAWYKEHSSISHNWEKALRTMYLDNSCHYWNPSSLNMKVALEKEFKDLCASGRVESLPMTIHGESSIPEATWKFLYTHGNTDEDVVAGVKLEEPQHAIHNKLPINNFRLSMTT